MKLNEFIELSKEKDLPIFIATVDGCHVSGIVRTYDKDIIELMDDPIKRGNYDIEYSFPWYIRVDSISYIRPCFYNAKKKTAEDQWISALEDFYIKSDEK
jgi:hypothetical protein